MSSFGSFTAGTLILTPRGDCLVQDLQAGDLVETLDNGAQPVRFTRRTRVAAGAQEAPVRFREGVLGNAHDLLVAPDHRIRFAGWQSDLLFGEQEVLVPACAFVNGVSVTREPALDITYHALLLDGPQIVFAERVATECGTSLEDISDRPRRRDMPVYHGLKPHEAQVLLAGAP